MTRQSYSVFRVDNTSKYIANTILFVSVITSFGMGATEGLFKTNKSAIRVVAETVKKTLNEELIFKGSVSVYNKGWQINGDHGVLKGGLGGSKELIVTGNPAFVETESQSSFGKSLGSAKMLILSLEDDKLELKGNAEFESQSERLKADVIYFDMTTRSLKTKGSRIKFFSSKP